MEKVIDNKTYELVQGDCLSICEGCDFYDVDSCIDVAGNDCCKTDNGIWKLKTDE